MAKEQIVRKASDNKYLHRDFHNGLNFGLEYIRKNYGEDAVREYLRQYATAFHAPLKEAIKSRGLRALKEYLENIYSIEEAPDVISSDMTENMLEVRISSCPAVTHMNRSGIEVSPLFYETTKTVYETLCEGTPFAFSLVSYNKENGASILLFSRKEEQSL